MKFEISAFYLFSFQRHFAFNAILIFLCWIIIKISENQNEIHLFWCVLIKKYISDSYNIAVNWCWKVKFLIFTVHIIFSTYYLPRFQKYIHLRDITLITVSFYIFTSSNCIKIISFNFFLFTNFRITQILIEYLIIFKRI